MTKKYFIYREDGMLLSTAFLEPEEAEMQVNITDIEPELEVGRVPWFIDGAWEMREPVIHREGSSEMRQRAYPSIGEQLDMLWHAMDRGEVPKAEAFYETLKAVKEAVPKPDDSGRVFEVGAMPEA